jgi:hypothetical protein
VPQYQDEQSPHRSNHGDAGESQPGTDELPDYAEEDEEDENNPEDLTRTEDELAEVDGQSEDSDTTRKRGKWNWDDPKPELPHELVPAGEDPLPLPSPDQTM